MVSANRFLILPLIFALRAERTDAAGQHWKAACRNTVGFLRDVLHTALALGSGNFDPGAVESLRRVRLESVRPARRPRHLSPPYRFTPFIADTALDAHRNPIPLALQWQGERREFSHGLGFGAHARFAFEYELPPGVFSRLTGLLGLHADCGKKGNVRFQWLRDERPQWEITLSEDHPSEPFDLDVSQGGWWALVGEAPIPLSPENNLALADPLLLR